MPLMIAPAVASSSSPAERASIIKMTPRVLTEPNAVPSRRLSRQHRRKTHRMKQAGSTHCSV